MSAKEYNLNSNFMSELFNDMNVKTNEVSAKFNRTQKFNESDWGNVFNLSKRGIRCRKTQLNELVADEEKTTAIIVYGLSCSGKTTLSKQLGEELGAEVISMDLLEMNAMLENPTKVHDVAKIDDISNNKMSELLRKYGSEHKTVIVEGQYVTIHARAAVLKALELCGYNQIIGVSTVNLNPEIRMAYALKRMAFENYIAAQKCDPIKKANILKSNYYNMEISDDELAKYVNKSDAKMKILEIAMHFMAESQSSNVAVQNQFNLFKYGFDRVCEYN